MTGRVAANGEPLTVADLTAHEASLPPDHAALLRFGYRAWLGVPVTMGDRLTGVLDLRSRASRRFSAEEISIAVAFASQAAAAIENVRLYDEANRRRHEAEAMAHLSRLLTESLDVAVVAQQVVERVHDLLGTRSSVLRLLEPDGSLRAVAFGGTMLGHLPAGHVAPPGVGVGALAIVTGRPAWTHDPLTDGRFRVVEELRRGYELAGVASLLSIPLRVKGKVIGVLSLGDVAGRVFSESEIVLVQTVADHAAAAVENMRLYEEARTALEALSRTQEQLVHAHKMEAIGRLAGGVAHDFNNLLTVILGRSQLLLEELAPDHPLQRHAALIEKTASRAAALTRQLLAFSLKQVLQPKLLNLNVVVAEMMALVE
ncbi:MAG: GAF domain-containing protein, partial [Candidatus Rokuibacteriota bacterium]